VYRVRSCAGIETTNVAFGGVDRKKLFIVESGTGSILESELDVSGKRMYSHSGV
jgi:gluconolactonase